MCIETKYLIDKFKKIADPFKVYFIFKNLYEYIDKNKTIHRVWFEEDLKPDIIYIKKTIVGLGYSNDTYGPIYWLNSLYENCHFTLSFSYSWKKIGKFVVSLKDLENDAFNAFIKSIYAQLLMYIDNGNDIYVGYTLLFKKKSTYNILVETDFNT